MSDWNLTPFEKIGSPEPSIEPKVKPFSSWAGTTETADPARYVDYSRYLTKEYGDQGALTNRSYQKIQRGLYKKLTEFYGDDQEAIEALVVPPEPSFEDKLQVVNNYLPTRDEDYKTLVDYVEAEQVAEADENVSEEFLKSVSNRKQEAEQVINNRYEEAVTGLVNSGELPIGSFINEDGEREVIVGDGIKDLSIGQAIESSQRMGVSMDDYLHVQRELTPILGTDIKLYKYKQLGEIRKSIAELAKTDEETAERLEGLAKLAGSEDDTWLEKKGDLFMAVVGDFAKNFGIGEDEMGRKIQRVSDYALSEDINVYEIRQNINKATGANYSFEDVSLALKEQAVSIGMQKGYFKFQQDPEKAGDNVIMTASGPIINPKAYAREEDLRNTLNAVPELSGEISKRIMENRESVLQANFVQYNKQLTNSAVGDEWQKAYIEGIQQGKTELEIFNQFTQKEDNFNEFVEGAKGLGISLFHGIGQLFYLAPTMLDWDWGKEGLARIAKRESDRAAVAELFGEQYGIIQEASLALFPMVVDIAATTLLSIPSAGAGGAAYLTAKTGSRLTAKGLGKALFTNALRGSGERGLALTAEKAVANKLIKESSETGGRSMTIEAIEAFNNATAKEFGLVPAMFVPAASRSAAASYGSLYNQLRQNPDISEQEAHDRSLGFSLINGAVTGGFVVGFRAFGRGGVEDALLKGMTFRQAKEVFKALGNTSGITNKTVAGAMKKVMNEGLKRSAGLKAGIGKNVIDEGLEEGLDQFVNSFVQDVALNQNTPMMERFHQSFNAAMVGGLIGGTVPLVQAGARRLNIRPIDKLTSMVETQNKFINDVTEELANSGSPLSAREVRSLLIGRVDERAPVEVTPVEPIEPPTQSTTTTTLQQESNRRELPQLLSRSEELDQELKELKDESTLPKQKKKREAAIAQRELDVADLEQEIAEVNNRILEVEEENKTLEPEEDRPYVSLSGLPALQEDSTPLTADELLEQLAEVTPLQIEVAFGNLQDAANLEGAPSSEILNQELTLTETSDLSGVTSKEKPVDLKSAKEGRQRIAQEQSKNLTSRGPVIDHATVNQRGKNIGVEPNQESRQHVADQNNKNPETELEPSAAKPFASRSSASTLKFEKTPFKGKDAAERAKLFIDFALKYGFPSNLSTNANYGLPIPKGMSRQKVAEFLSSIVYAAYPTTTAPKNAKAWSSSLGTKTYFDPVSGKTVKQKVKGFVDAAGRGIFDNNPVVVAEMLQSGIVVKVPRSFKRSKLNPAFRVNKAGVVTHVMGPTTDGSGLLEVKSSDEKQIAPLHPDTTQAEKIKSVPFKPATDLPAGVKEFDPENGGPLQEDFADTTSIKRRITQFFQELMQKGDSTNRRVQARLDATSGSLDPEFRKASFETAKQQFLFNAQLFALRDKFITNPSKIVSEITKQIGATSKDEAAQRLLPFITITQQTAAESESTAGDPTQLQLPLTTGPEITLTSDRIIELFIDQKLDNNPDFAGNTAPTFDSLLAKASNQFKNQEESATRLRKARAVGSLPSDLTSDQLKTQRVVNWVNNFGRNPDGDLPTPESLAQASAASIDAAVEALNSDPILRRKVNQMILESIIAETPDTLSMVHNATARDALGLFTSWLASGNGNTRESVTEFMSQLGDGTFPSGGAFQNALILTNFVNRPDGAGYENADAVAEYQIRFLEATGEDITLDQATNAMIALSRGVRSRLSRSNISAALRGKISEQNEVDIKNLGIESGNPDSVIAALDKVAKSSKNPLHKVVAKLLLKDKQFIKKVKFVIGSGAADIAGKYVKQTDGSHVVFVNRTSGNGRGLVNTLLEEYVHAFVSDTLNTPREQLKKRRRGVLTRVIAIETVLSNARSAYKNQGGFDPILEEALSNSDEFFAQFLLSEDVQKFVKALVAPENKTPFFNRLINHVVNLFPNVTPAEAKEATEALMDVLDLGRRPYKTTTTDAKALSNSATNDALSSATVESEEEATLADEASEEQAQARREELNQKINDESERLRIEEETELEEYLESIPEGIREAARKVYEFVKSITPLGMNVRISYDKDPASVSASTSTISINPESLLNSIDGASKFGARIILGKTIHEELAHTASWSSLTAEEINNYINNLSEQDYADIAEDYYSNSPQSYLDRSIRNLGSQNPDVVRAERYALAQEKLRMHLQKVTTGYTTEEDIAFWRKKPSLFKILKRYLTGIYNKWAANRSRLGRGGDVIFNNIITEMRAMEAGFMRTPTKMSFDPDSPMSALKMFGTIEGQNWTDTPMRAAIVERYTDTVSSQYPTSAYNVIYGGRDKPKGITSNNQVASYLRDEAVEYHQITITNDDGESMLVPITAKTITPEKESEIVSIALEEVLQALEAKGENAADWYTTAVEAAMAVAGVIYPELKNSTTAAGIPAFSKAKNPDQAADLVMKMALAITSQNLNVRENTRYADEQYRIFRDTGKFDPTKVYGSKAEAIQKNLLLANMLIEKFGFEGAIEFIESDYNVGGLKKKLKAEVGDQFSVTGQTGLAVQGAAIFGPKIGQGFLQNLRASVMADKGKGYEPVTIDLWLRRTWGRWTGDSAGKGLTTELAAEFLQSAREFKVFPTIDNDLVDTVAEEIAKNVEEDPEAKPNDSHKKAAREALETVIKLSVKRDGSDLGGQSKKLFLSDYNYQLALFHIGRSVASKGEKAYNRTREHLPPEISGKILRGEDFDSKEIYDYLKKRDEAFKRADSKLSKKEQKGATKKERKAEFNRNYTTKKYGKSVNPILPQKFIDAIRSGDYNLDEIVAYQTKQLEAIKAEAPEKENSKENEKRIKNFYLKDGVEVLPALNVRGLKRPWQNIAKRVKESIKPIDAPSNLERKVISRVINKVRVEMEKLGFTTSNADIQAILWYPEKDIWSEIQGKKADNLKTSYDETYLELAREQSEEIYEQALKAKSRVEADRRRDRDARANVAPRREADVQNAGLPVGEQDATQAGEVGLSAAPVEPSEVAGWPRRVIKKAGESDRVAAKYTGKPKSLGQLRPEGQAELARSLAVGEITPEEYEEEYNERFGAPTLSDRVPEPSTLEELASASKKIAEKAFNPEEVPEGRVKVRIDINAFKKGIWAVTLHEDTKSKPVIGYTPSAVLTGDISFTVEQTAAASTAIGGEKIPMATIDGDYVALTSEEAAAEAEAALASIAEGGETDPDKQWVEIGMNPYRHSYFYDKAEQRPLIKAKRLVQVGGLVLVQGAEFGNKTKVVEGKREFLYSAPVSSASATSPSVPASSVPRALGPVGPARLTGTGVDFSAVVDLLELPMYEIDTSQPSNAILKYINKLFAGEIPEVFRRLVQNRDAYGRVTEKNVVAYKKELDKLIKDTYGDYESAPMETIAAAQGYKSGNVLSEEESLRIEEDYQLKIDGINQQREDGAITKSKQKSLISEANKERDAELDRSYESALAGVEAARDAALKEIAKDSTDLASHIIDIRQKLIIPLQKKLIEAGLNKNISMKISKTGGIYITRSYRMFTDSSYFQKISEGSEKIYRDRRDAAMAFFEKEFLKKTEDDIASTGVDRADARVLARKVLDKENALSHQSYGQQALNTFLAHYDNEGSVGSTPTPKGYDVIADNLKTRRDLPKEVRDLLGEYGPEVGADLILRTYATVATVTAQQTFLNQLREVGEKSGLMVDEETKFASEAANETKYISYVKLRVSSKSGGNDPLSGMYVQKEFRDELERTLRDPFSSANVDTAQRAIDGVVTTAAKLTGKAMAAKTLGSIGFYARNAIGNLFFGWSQGYMRFDEITAGMVKGTVKAMSDPDSADPELLELIGLNVVGDEVRSGMMRDLLNGTTTPEGIQQQLSDLADKTKLSKLGKSFAWAEKKAQDLSAALDASYKTAYFYHELKVLQDAQAADTTGKLSAMDEKQLKRLAARKVVMTSQAYSQAPPIVKRFTRSPLGLQFAPFLRFKVEMPRIFVNTMKLAKEEMKSGNPVLVRRGAARATGMFSMITVVSSAIPMVLAAASGIGDEEDESLRASIPRFLRGHTFFYTGKGKDRKSIDLTYVNPFSLLVDPFLRAYENVRRGQFAEAAVSLVAGYISDQYLDDQILASAVSDVSDNTNPSTGNPIWIKGADSPFEAVLKSLTHIFKEAYAPRLGTDIMEGIETRSVGGFIEEVWDGVKPFRTHDLDLDQQYRRYLKGVNERYSNVKRGLNVLKRDKPLSPENVREIINDNIEDRKRLNYEILRINQGFHQLGLSHSEIVNTMYDAKVGKNRINLLSYGFMDKPSMKYIIESLADPRNEEWGGLQRANTIVDYVGGMNRYLPVRPVTESE
jgi:hypothetical protein